MIIISPRSPRLTGRRVAPASAFMACFCPLLPPALFSFCQKSPANSTVSYHFKCKSMHPVPKKLLPVTRLLSLLFHCMIFPVDSGEMCGGGRKERREGRVCEAGKKREFSLKSFYPAILPHVSLCLETTVMMMMMMAVTMFFFPTLLCCC